MANGLSKSLQSILVNVTHYDKDVPDEAQINPQTVTMTLADKLDKHIARMGYTNAAIYDTALRLLTKGKIRLEFKTYVERLALADPADKMSEQEAAAVIDKFVADIRDQEEGRNTTQKIVIHH